MKLWLIKAFERGNNGKCDVLGVFDNRELAESKRSEVANDEGWGYVLVEIVAVEVNNFDPWGI